MKLSIVVPLYNEPETVLAVLDQLLKLSLPAFVESREIIIVDDCSTDGSHKNVEQYRLHHPELILLHHEQNMGKGRAVKTGIEKSSGDVILIQDSDLELSPSDIPAMLSAMHDLNIEFVNGSRYLDGIVRPLASYHRYIVNKLFTWLTSILINVRLTDMACGYKLFTRSLYNRISLHENRFGFEAELIIKALRVKRNNVAEVPVKYFPRREGEGKKLKPFDGVKILWTIFRYGVLKMR
ncbi:MAG TPA: glycosyltransferase family 2 protein [Bacteroidia bacterium]|nr:glycosyltransferase family 2 protein [Bacteroidia bacterium]